MVSSQMIRIDKKIKYFKTIVRPLRLYIRER